jgi:hypothetical protein
VGGAAYVVSAAGYEGLFGQGRGTVDGVVQMITLDSPTYLSLLAVTGVQAPLLEETVFRGFLLTSLTRFMPTWAAVFASALAFGIAHLSLKDLPVLVALGTWMGFMYVRSKSLLTPMLIHGTWNSFVLTLLFYLSERPAPLVHHVHAMHRTCLRPRELPACRGFSSCCCCRHLYLPVPLAASTGVDVEKLLRDING